MNHRIPLPKRYYLFFALFPWAICQAMQDDAQLIEDIKNLPDIEIRHLITDIEQYPTTFEEGEGALTSCLLQMAEQEQQNTANAAAEGEMPSKGPIDLLESQEEALFTTDDPAYFYKSPTNVDVRVPKTQLYGITAHDLLYKPKNDVNNRKAHAFGVVRKALQQRDTTETNRNLLAEVNRKYNLYHLHSNAYFIAAGGVALLTTLAAVLYHYFGKENKIKEEENKDLPAEQETIENTEISLPAIK